MNINDIISLVKNHNVVAFGEATHGQLKITILRIKIFKILCTKYKFDTFILEDQYSTCKLFNSFIKHKSKYTLTELMKRLMPPWQTKELYNLFIWMKEYNKSHNNSLSVYGVDIQFNTPGYIIRSKTDVLANTYQSRFYKNKKMRDYYMFKMFECIYRPHHKYFIYAHVGHVGCFIIWNKPSMGCRIRKVYDYIVVGNSFNTGHTMGFNPSIKKYEIMSAPQIKKINIPFGFTILASKTFNISTGGFYVDKQNPTKSIEIDAVNNNNLDAIIVIPDEKPLYIAAFSSVIDQHI